MGSRVRKSTVLESGHVAYQINRNKENGQHASKQEAILLTPLMETAAKKGLFQKVVMLYIKLRGMKSRPISLIFISSLLSVNEVHK